MKFIDTHAHLYSAEFDYDRTAVIARAHQKGVEKIILPAIDSETFDAMMQLQQQHPDLCLAANGLHPCSVKPDTLEKELLFCEDKMKTHPFVAIGECGIDLYWDKSTFDLQKEALAIQCGWAIDQNLPIIIHSRNATRECIDVLKPFVPKGLAGVFHCFSGSIEEAAEIVEMGFYLGIGGVITFKKSDLPAVVKQTGLSKLILETDSPYLAPVPHRGKRNESAYLRYIVDELSTIFMLGSHEIASITTQNAKTLFRL
jgi:TatD DNase family protein